jgi:Fe2+ or Zn2+ uptake regulation protein
MSHKNVDYASKIRDRGFRLTPQRELILDAVCEGGGHTTFDEIYDRVQARAPAVSVATIYRTLDFWCEMGVVVSAEIDGQKVYEIAKQQPHHHLVCRTCGCVEPLEHELMQGLFETIEKRHRFHIDMDHLVLRGRCERCRQTPTS